MGSNHMHSSFRQSGFSLIEIMVGLVIGLLATLVIMQVFSVFEGQKRTTTGVADAQTNGSIALYTIAREMQMSGFGLLPVTDSPLECEPPLNIDPDTGIADISPIVITDGGTAAGASDSITIRYSTSDSGGIPVQIITAGAPLVVGSNMGCQGNNIALIMNGSACALTSASAVEDTTTQIALATTPVEAVNNANIACLGTWNEITYSVNNGNLERNAEPAIADIVNIQAQYGISDAANSNQITQWVDASAAAGWSAPTVADRNRIKAVRIAVVARNGLLEKENVSLPCSSLTSDAPTGLCAWSGSSTGFPAPAINLSNDADGTSWQRYRYRVFETIVPLRNMIWASRETL